MINAQKDHLQSFFQGGLRYIVPFFQRPYVWDEENWEDLWENLVQILDDIHAKSNSEHFIGTLIFKQRQAEHVGDNSYDLIDGQQRLTTVALLLKAIADTVTGEVPNLSKVTNDLLVFEDSYGNRYHRIEHNRTDKPYFDAIISDADTSKLQRQDHKFLLAYKYFKGKVQSFTDQRRDLLVKVIKGNVPVISMMLSVDDDEQVIFDTINSLGVKLTTAELLKNYVFKDDHTRAFYDSQWAAVFEADDDQVSFWNKNKTAGRVIRTNIEVLLYCFLMIKTKREIRIERLFKEYKDWLRDQDPDQRIQFLEELAVLADIYFKIPDGEELNEFTFNDHEERFFHVINGLNITTAYPLILFIYREFDLGSRLVQIRVLESYLVRRNVCRLTTKNYNNLFLSVLQKLDDLRAQNLLKPDSLRGILVQFDDATNLFPNDEDVKEAFASSILTNQNAKEILFCIALSQQGTVLHDVPKMSASSFSIEHIMPRKWDTHWARPDFSDEERSKRDRKIKTLGNLTLITKRLNSKLKNAPWSEKQTTLRQYSSLQMTTHYLDHEEWDEDLIANRARDFAKEAINIWPR